MGRKVARYLGFLRKDWLRFPLALAAGVILWALSLPPYGFGILAIVAFIPPLTVLPDETPGRVAAWGWLGGAAWEFVTLWWLIPTLTNYGAISLPVATLLILGMCAVLGLYMAGFLGLLCAITKRRGEGALLLAPFLWVLWEWLRGHLFTGFPWWGPGYGLSVYQAFLQTTRIAGILGLSFLAVGTASAVALYLRERTHPAALVGVPVFLVLLLTAFIWGAWQDGRPITPKPEERVGYLQPNIPQDQKWNHTYAEATMQRFENLSLAFKHYRLKLLVWPESSTPFEWDEDQTFRDRVMKIARADDAPILLGTVTDSGKGYQNSAILLMPDGKVAGRYAKIHLVPFGEYVPLRRWLFFARPIVDTIGDFVPGKEGAPLQTPAGKVGVTICYEGIFPELVRRKVRAGAELLVNMTNDAWYKGTPGPVQHFLMERVRAVETDRYLIRSANEGVSGIVDPRGRLESTTPPNTAASFWGLVEPRRTETLWTRIGDFWLFIPLLVVLAAFLPGRRHQGWGRTGPPRFRKCFFSREKH